MNLGNCDGAKRSMEFSLVLPCNTYRNGCKTKPIRKRPSFKLLSKQKLITKTGMCLAQRFRNSPLAHSNIIREEHPEQRFCAFLLKPFSVAKRGNRRAGDLERRRFIYQKPRPI